MAQRVIPGLLGLVGVDSVALSTKLSGFPALSAALAGGVYPDLWQTVSTADGREVVAPAFAGWEVLLATFLYHYFVPSLQFFVAVLVVDTWQYFWHRAMHLNRWLYGESI